MRRGNCDLGKSCEFVQYFGEIEVCDACGLGRTLFTGRAPELQNYLPHDHAVRLLKTARLTRVYRLYLRSAGPGSLLDVGCAEGMLLDIAAADGWCVVGLDSYALRNDKRQIVAGRFLDFNHANSFDALSFVHSFEHMDDPVATLRKCRSLVRPQGRLLIVVPNFGGWWAQTTRHEWQWLNVEEHRYHYTRQALATLLGQAEFRIEVCRTYSGYAPSMPEVILSKMGAFTWPGFRWRPIRSALYRLSRLAGTVCNPIVDLAGRGAELEVLARPI